MDKYNIHNTNAHLRQAFVQLRNTVLRKDKHDPFGERSFEEKLFGLNVISQTNINKIKMFKMKSFRN